MTEARKQAPSDLMLYRSVSQMVKIFVLPKIDRRVASGVLVFRTTAVLNPSSDHFQ